MTLSVYNKPFQQNTLFVQQLIINRFSKIHYLYSSISPMQKDTILIHLLNQIIGTPRLNLRFPTPSNHYLPCYNLLLELYN